MPDELIPQRWYLLYESTRFASHPPRYVGRTTVYEQAVAHLQTGQLPNSANAVMVVTDTSVTYCYDLVTLTGEAEVQPSF